MPIPVINAYASIQSDTRSHLPIHSCGGQLYLYPVSLDEKPEYYQCKVCNHTITIAQRDEVFQQILEQTKSRYQLKTLEWSAVGGLQMESAVFIGEHRLAARRRSIKPSERREITDYILMDIQLKLGISVDNLHSLFKEEPEHYYHI